MAGSLPPPCWTLDPLVVLVLAVASPVDRIGSRLHSLAHPFERRQRLVDSGWQPARAARAVRYRSEPET